MKKKATMKKLNLACVTWLLTLALWKPRQDCKNEASLGYILCYYFLFYMLLCVGICMACMCVFHEHARVPVCGGPPG